jgi:hypothetical protein
VKTEELGIFETFSVEDIIVRGARAKFADVKFIAAVDD